ncbi:MAG TPA: AmmeMemoRadiSam system protein B, partial [Candidatus Eisenbacteria bacterium]|nr:AmmeMemoRadiSam system protein B [Candidatus Eisenbacteria bacterium]
MDPLPRLRALEILRLPEQDGGDMFLLRDPEGYSDQELVMSEAALFVAAHGDGAHTLDQLRANFETRYGKPLDRIEAQAVFDRLEAAFMLESNAFLEERDRAHRDFLDAPCRRAAHAGRSYPEDADQAKETASRFLHEAVSIEEPGERPTGMLRGLVAPHIDLRVGGAATALAYRMLLEAPEVETVIVLGTSHACGRQAWIVSDKPFDTPLGLVPVNVDLCRHLAAQAKTQSEDLFFHRREHSIEFQAFFLAALRREGRDLNLVPVLCGSLRGAGDPPLDDSFLAELGRMVSQARGKVILLAAADLAHVGPRFGDPEALTSLQLRLLEKKDRATLEHVCRGDAAGFFTDVLEAGDPRRICGLAPVFG